MLHQFLVENRSALIDICKAKVAKRSNDLAAPNMAYGIPLFLDQLIKTLQIEQTASATHSEDVSGPADGRSNRSELGIAATQHGRELSENGFTVEQVVRDYGDLCQAITTMAVDVGAEVTVDEFRTLNRCLDNGIADAVTEFSRRRTLARNENHVKSLNQSLGVLAHELRNHSTSASFAFSAIKSGKVGIEGATGGVLERSLNSLRSIIALTMAEVRLTAGMPPQHELICLDDLISEVRASASLEAIFYGCSFEATAIDRTIRVRVDKDLLKSAVSNLLQNAFKFTKHGTHVSLSARVDGKRVHIDVEDCCGGLPPGDHNHLFTPFDQQAADRSGLGLGLSICRSSVRANNGVLSVRDVPGFGCVFSIELPVHLKASIETSESADH